MVRNFAVSTELEAGARWRWDEENDRLWVRERKTDEWVEQVTQRSDQDRPAWHRLMTSYIDAGDFVEIPRLHSDKPNMEVDAW